MRAAYDALEPQTKAAIEGLRVHHSIAYSRQTLGFEFSQEEEDKLKGAVHPLVRTNPRTRRRSLYLASHASRIIDWPVPEGRLLLRDLIEHATQPQFVYRHVWRAGDLVIWDNRATMHRARPFDDAKDRRELRRVTTLDIDAPALGVTGNTCAVDNQALTRMHIVDSQLHLWAANTPQRPWPPGRERDAQRPYPITKETLLFEMDLAGVSRAVLVPPSWEGDRNDLALEAARQYPDRFARDGPPRAAGPHRRDLLAGWKKQPGMLGMRFTFHNQHNRHFLTDGTADWLWPAAERSTAFPLMVLVPGSLEAIGRIAARHPGLKLVIDHAGLQIHAKAPAVLEDLPAVCALAKHPNVAVKASGLVGLVGTALSVPRRARDRAQAVRLLRPAPHVLGHGPHPHAVHLPRVHRPVHQGAGLAEGRGSRVGDGARGVRVAGLAFEPVISDL